MRLLTQPTSKYQSGTTESRVILKYGAGSLHGVVLSGIVNNSVVTLYDNIASTGTTVWSSGEMGAQTIPVSLDMKGLPFYTGLTLTVTAANSNALVIYE